MSLRRLVLCGLVIAGTAFARGAEDFLDRVEEALTTSALQGQFRARLSGTLDLEDYRFPAPAPALIHEAGDQYFNARLALFLDAQLGPRAYFFAQARADRGFDPGAKDAQVRLDEYALRLTPWSDGRAILQVGKFATVIGNWVPRHGSWANPFIDAPLPYENLTGIWDVEPVRSTVQLQQWSHVRPGLPAFITAGEKFRRLPIIWGPSYATGAALSGALGKFQYAVELKLGSLSSRPEAWNRLRGHEENPTVSGRLGWRPNQMWTLGVSASAGSYLRPFAEAVLPAGHGLGDYRQLVVAQDVGFAWHHWQIWSEIFAARFEIPNVGHADTLAYYAEAKYKFTPQLFGALRWNEQLFGALPNGGTMERWGRDASRLDLAAGYRFTPHTQLKLQYDLQAGDVDPRSSSHLLAVQFTLRF